MILRDPIRPPSRWLPLLALVLLALAVPAWTLGQQDPARPAEPPQAEAAKPAPDRAEAVSPARPVAAAPADSDSTPGGRWPPGTQPVAARRLRSAAAWTIDQYSATAMPAASLAGPAALAFRHTAAGQLAIPGPSGKDPGPGPERPTWSLGARSASGRPRALSPGPDRNAAPIRVLRYVE